MNLNINTSFFLFDFLLVLLLKFFGIFGTLRIIVTSRRYILAAENMTEIPYLEQCKRKYDEPEQNFVFFLGFC